ncbi:MULTISPECIES: hypothetical protein [Streptomyces]|uniref:CdaR GGDEF-like domain-containing protein n=1 Tax=Streptomyces canarius TaxID=285453 RepID=A0ABQ3CJP5_9ACTN|nr:hypothetical protein [Streptomyces canarius]GHA09303.1 hypothetical protein GCM10010345_12220 [Streptomyces canarius]
MNAPHSTDVVPPVPPRPAAPLQPILKRALEEADFAADVAVDADSLLVSVITIRVPWHPTTAEAAQEWMRTVDVSGEARWDGGGIVVLHLHEAAAVHRFIALLEPQIRANATAAGLRRVLRELGVDSVTGASREVIDLRLGGDELGSAVALAEQLGAPRIAEGLELGRPRGQRRLAERFRYLVTGVVGSLVDAVFEPGCAHEEESLTLYLSVDQAGRLLQRLSRDVLDGSVSADARRLVIRAGEGS